MTDRTVKVRLEADISDFVTDVGVKAVAAVNRLERAATKANKSIAGVGSKKTLDPLATKADKVSEKLTKVGATAKASGEKVKAAGAEAAAGLDKTATAADKATKSADKASQATQKLGEKVSQASAKTKTSATEATEATEKASQATQKATEATTKATAATESNSKAVTVAAKNADAHANALGRLRTAQLRLTEVQNRRGSAGTSALAGAEESVAAAERAVKKIEKAGDAAGRGFTAKLKKWFVGDGSNIFKELGKNSGNGFLGALTGALKTPIIGPILAAVITAAVVTVLPAAGALAAGLFVTAFGGGLATLGIIFAAKSQAVKDKWTSTLGQMGSDLQLLATPFQKTLTDIAGFFQRTVDNFNPTLSKAFASMAGPVSKFADDLGRGLEKLIPAIQPIVAAFNASLAALGGALPGAIQTMATGFTKLAESVSRNPKALADTVSGLADLVSVITGFITTLNNVNTQFSTLTGGLSLVNVTFAALEGLIGPLSFLFEGLGKGIEFANIALGKSGKDSDSAGSSMSAAANKTADLANKLGTLGGAAQHGAAPVKDMAKQIADAKQKIADAKAATQAWIASLFELQNLALGLAGAQISYQQSIDAVTASIKANGRTHDINTAKGQANKQALLDNAKAANVQTQAMLDNKKGVRAAADAASASRASFISLAEKMGYTKAQAQAMAKQFLAIPKKTETDFKADISDLNSKLASARKQLADPNLTRTRKAELRAEIKQLLAAKAQAQAAINSLTGKTVSVTMNTYKNMVETHTVKTVGVLAPQKGAQANGGYYPSGIPSYADGKLPMQATIAPGKGAGMVQWAEKETGGEAFIPMAPSKRDRSTKILGQVANNFGLGLVKSFADGGFLPGGKLVDINYLIRQLGIPFNPSAGVNYGSTLAAQNKANAAVVAPQRAATAAAAAERAAKAERDRLQREITLQQRAVTAQRGERSTAKDPKVRARENAANDKKVKKEQQDLIALQDKLYKAKLKLTAATNASNKADATLKLRQEAAAKATEAHKAAVEKLIAQQQAAVDMAAQISDGLTAGANIGDLFQNSLTGKGLLADLQAQGAQTGVFGGQISKLRKQGLSEDLIQQIIGKGAEQGGEVAQAILDGGQGLVNALNKAQKALDDQANLIGAGSAEKKYGQKIYGARAKGGDVMAGKTYLVGENGPEPFQPGITGRILPNQYIGGFGAGGGSRSETHYHLVQSFTGVSLAEADLIGRRSLAVLRLAGRR